MLFFHFLLTLITATLALAAPTGRYGKTSTPAAARAVGEQMEIFPVRWVTSFGPEVTAGSTLDLHWEGGSGYGYEIYYVPQWPGQSDYELIPILPETTDRYVGWKVPQANQYPDGTTFIIGVKDLYASTAGYYDLTPIMKFVA